MTGLTPTLGMWRETEATAGKQYLSINLHPGSRPGVVSKVVHVELWYASERESADMDGGKEKAYLKAQEILDHIDSKHNSECFARVISLSGIIGPKETEHLRQAYMIPIEITY